MRDGLVACGSNGNGRMVGLDALVGPFQPCDYVIWDLGGSTLPAVKLQAVIS